MYKAKDTPWDAVLVGSVVCTVTANVQYFIITLLKNSIFFKLTILTMAFVICFTTHSIITTATAYKVIIPYKNWFVSCLVCCNFVFLIC